MHNSINLEAETCQYDNRREGDAREAEYRLIEDVGVVAAAASHQDKAKDDDAQTYKHQLIILFCKRKTYFRFFFVIFHNYLFLIY